MSEINMVKSISYEQEEIIQWIIKLHLKGKDIELDCCYSTGNFYKKNINPPKYKFDIKQQVDGVIEANAENLPLENERVDSIMFDHLFSRRLARVSKQKP